MDFCPNCESALYPTEIRDKVGLYMVCRICDYEGKNTNEVVRRKIYKTANVQDFGTNRTLIYSNAYARTKKIPCPNTDCPSLKDSSLQEAIIYNNPENLHIVYICCACNTEWS